jgi:uncharacterized protein YecE (DUF72 family)
MNVADAETKDARLAEDAMRERIRDEEEETATLMRRKRLHTYHYNDDKTCELCHHCKIKAECGVDVYCEIDNEDINVEDAACNDFEDK